MMLPFSMFVCFNSPNVFLFGRRCYQREHTFSTHAHARTHTHYIHTHTTYTHTYRYSLYTHTHTHSLYTHKKNTHTADVLSCKFNPAYTHPPTHIYIIYVWMPEYKVYTILNYIYIYIHIYIHIYIYSHIYHTDLKTYIMYV